MREENYNFPLGVLRVVGEVLKYTGMIFMLFLGMKKSKEETKAAFFLFCGGSDFFFYA